MDSIDFANSDSAKEGTIYTTQRRRQANTSLGDWRLKQPMISSLFTTAIFHPIHESPDVFCFVL